jgi:hypothetical protein
VTAKEDESGFFARWSRRKADAARGELAPGASETAREVPQDPRSTSQTGGGIERAPGTAIGSATGASSPQVPSTAAEPLRTGSAEAPALTLADVARLGRDSDYAPFVQAGVDPTVKNAALKKLFADPRFNVMDGLDTYIDDYGKPDPIPPAMLRRLNQARHLGLFDADLEEKDGTSTAEPQPSALGAPPSASDVLPSAVDAPPSATTVASAGDTGPIVAPDPVR